jgi:hypothetical protein
MNRVNFEFFWMVDANNINRDGQKWRTGCEGRISVVVDACNGADLIAVSRDKALRKVRGCAYPI